MLAHCISFEQTDISAFFGTEGSAVLGPTMVLHLTSVNAHYPNLSYPSSGILAVTCHCNRLDLGHIHEHL